MLFPSLRGYRAEWLRGDAVALVGFAEGLGAAKTYAARQHYDVDVNRELLGLGAANAGAGLAGGMVVNGSLSKTAVNGGAGAKSQVRDILRPEDDDAAEQVYPSVEAAVEAVRK